MLAAHPDFVSSVAAFEGHQLGFEARVRDADIADIVVRLVELRSLA